MTRQTAPKTWTTRYVTSHYAECLAFIRKLNKRVIRDIRYGKYAYGIAVLQELQIGLEAMHRSGCGNYRTYLSMYSLVEVILLLAYLPTKVNQAVSSLEYAQDLVVKAETIEDMKTLLKHIEGYPIDHRKMEGAIEILNKLDRQLSLIWRALI